MNIDGRKSKKRNEKQTEPVSFRIKNKDVWNALKYYCLIEKIDIGDHMEKLIKKDLKEKLKDEMVQRYNDGTIKERKTKKEFLDSLKD